MSSNNACLLSYLKDLKTYLSSMMVVGITVFMIACGGPKVALISDSEIQAAQKSGQLPQLYDKAVSLAVASRGDEKKEAIQLQNQIAQMLVTEKSAQVDAAISRHKAQLGSVSRSQFLTLMKDIEAMKRWSATDYARLQLKLDSALSELNETIAQLVSESKSSNTALVDSVLLLKRAAEFAGSEQTEYEDYNNRLQFALIELSKQGNTALENRLYSKAKSIAEGALTLDPGNIQFESLLSQAQAGLFEKDFRFALESGKPESAYQAIQSVYDAPIFLQLKQRMGSSMMLLANYFAANGAKAFQNGNPQIAYESFLKGRDIQSKLGHVSPGFIQEKAFINKLMADAKNPQIAVGKRYLFTQILTDLDAQFSDLNSLAQSLKNQVNERAETKLALADFAEVTSSNSVLSTVGRRVSNQLEKLLFENKEIDIAIISSVSGVSQDPTNGLALIVNGDVLQSAIESSQTTGKRTQKVVTEINQVETEDYQKWKKRKRGESPPQYIENSVTENIVLTVTHISKLAIVEVAFKVVDPKNGTILLTDSIIKESSFKGEAVNEFKKGIFHQPYVAADLPSDIKIMDELSKQIADAIGEKLIKFLGQPEKIFIENSQAAVERGDFNLAVELLTNAIVIAENRGVSARDLKVRAKELALSTQ